MLSHYVDKLTHKDWDLYLPLVLLAYRTSCHAVTQLSPYELVFCRQPNLPMDCLVGTHGPPADDDPVGKVWELQDGIPGVMKLVRSYIAAGQEERNARSESAGYKPYQVGELVMISNSRTKKGLSRKLRSDKWEGPYRVIKVLSDVNYRVKRGRKKFLRHFNRLKPFIDRHDDPSDVVNLDEAQVQLEAGTVGTVFTVAMSVIIMTSTCLTRLHKTTKTFPSMWHETTLQVTGLLLPGCRKGQAMALGWLTYRGSIQLCRRVVSSGATSTSVMWWWDGGTADVVVLW